MDPAGIVALIIMLLAIPGAVVTWRWTTNQISQARQRHAAKAGIHRAKVPRE